MSFVGQVVGWGFSPDSFQLTEKYGGDDGTRTRGLCRDRAETTYNLLDFNGTDSPFLIP